METKDTKKQYKEIISLCRDLFLKKHQDYGSSWRILRPKSVTDQLYIKANRIRTLEETGINLVGESISSELIGLVNYSVIGLVQLGSLKTVGQIDLDLEDATLLFDGSINEAFELMEKKNHDYGEAWRNMRLSSITDLILTKLHRIKQIEDNSNKTLVSEPISSGYFDILNYAVFYLIRLNEMTPTDK